MSAKCALMVDYPYVSEFALKAYNECNQEVSRDIQEIYTTITWDGGKVIHKTYVFPLLMVEHILGIDRKKQMEQREKERQQQEEHR